MTSYHSRVRGCLLGGAIGDALGAPIEFDSALDLRERYGPSGLTELVPLDGLLGAVTDDTQMTLFTVDGLIRASVLADHARSDPAVALWRAYQRWLATQTGTTPMSEPGWLFEQDWLHAWRAPGNACLTGLSSGEPGTLQAPRNPDSKGCGAVMRSAPFGLLRRLDGAAVFRLAIDCAVHTHGHPTGYLAAGAFAVIVHRLVNGCHMREAAAAVLAELRGWPGHEETAAAIEAALAGGHPSASIVASLGEGWVAEEALAIGLYCALNCQEHGEIRDALLLAVNHSGDSDSTGSICGNLLGTAFGEDALPADWVVLVEGRDTISQLADDFILEMTQGSTLHGHSASPTVDHIWRQRYPAG